MIGAIGFLFGSAIVLAPDLLGELTVGVAAMLVVWRLAQARSARPSLS